MIICWYIHIYNIQDAYFNLSFNYFLNYVSKKNVSYEIFYVSKILWFIRLVYIKLKFLRYFSVFLNGIIYFYLISILIHSKFLMIIRGHYICLNLSLFTQFGSHHKNISKRNKFHMTYFFK